MRVWSVKSIEIAPTNTGKDKRRQIAVIIITHLNNGIKSTINPKMTEATHYGNIKFTAPRINLCTS